MTAQELDLHLAQFVAEPAQGLEHSSHLTDLNQGLGIDRSVVLGHLDLLAFERNLAIHELPVALPEVARPLQELRVGLCFAAKESKPRRSHGGLHLPPFGLREPTGIARKELEHAGSRVRELAMSDPT